MESDGQRRLWWDQETGEEGLTSSNDTLFALSSGFGRSAVAVVRISGPGARGCVAAIAGELPEPRRASLRHLRDPESGRLLDRGLVLWFPGPGSFTGEDMVEFQLHGGRAVVAAMLAALEKLPGLRPAEPGEFTRRAFDNGRMDLAAVEGLADLIDADTEAQRRQAIAQAEGALGRAVEAWASRLTGILARVEAAIDFVEEELPEDLLSQAAEDAADLRRELEGLLARPPVGERLREGLQIAILGPPNAGKSSLLNALAGREAAIVSERAGTTRDVVEVALDLGGYPLLLADTAGLRAAPEEEELDPIEAEGIRRSLARAESADLKLLLFDATTARAPDPASLALLDENTLVLWNKVDLISEDLPRQLGPAAAMPISAKSGLGLQELEERLQQEVEERFALGGEAPLITRSRHRSAIRDCAEALARAQEAGEAALFAEDLRLALRALGRIVGKVDVEDLLDVIFRDFCIGK